MLPLMSQIEYAQRALLRLEKKMPRAVLRLGKERTDGRQTDALGYGYG